MSINSLNTPFFCGLTKNLKKRMLDNPTTYNRLAQAANKPYAGSIPSDIAKRLNDNEIKKFIQSLDLGSDELKKVDKDIKEAIENININEFMDSHEDLVHNFDYEDFFVFFDEESLKTFGTKNFNEIKNNVQKILNEPLKSLGVEKVNLDFLGEGAFGRVYSLSFLDKKGEKVFHDKAFKVYKSRVEQLELLKILKNKLQNYNKNQLYKNGLINSIKFQEKYFNSHYSYSRSCHGILPEANCALYIKNNTKNMMQSDFIMPYMFNIKHGYAIFERADDELPKPDKKISLAKLGLYGRDFYKDANIVCSRIVDYGSAISKRKKG